MAVIEATSSEATGAKRPTRTLNWMEQMQHVRFHPYNQRMNKLLRSFGRMLLYVKPNQIDLDLTRLYCLSTGIPDYQTVDDRSDSHHSKVYAENFGDIKRWVYTALAEKINIYSKVFNPSMVAEEPDNDDDNTWHSAQYTNTEAHNTFRYKPIDFGYTINLPEFVQKDLLELCRNASEFSNAAFDDHTTQHKLKSLIEQTKIGISQAQKRYEMEYMNDLLDARRGYPRALSTEIMPVEKIVRPLLDYFPKISRLRDSIKDIREFNTVVEKLYSPNMLSIYGGIFEIITGLRLVNVEGTIGDLTLPYNLQAGWLQGVTNADKVQGASTDDWHYRWMCTLPSYRPEFLLTLSDFTEFDYREKLDVVTQTFDGSQDYAAATSVFEKQFVVAAK